MIDILKHWGFTDKKATQIDTHRQSAWTIGEQYILKHNTNTAEMSLSIRLAVLLAKEGVPVASYIPTTDGQITSPDGTYCLMNKISGKHVDLYNQPDLMFELGRELAKLHIALKNIEAQLNCRNNDFISEWESYIKPGLNKVSDEVVQLTEQKLYDLYDKLPRHPIHRDVHPQNILFDAGQISGWIDFDLNRCDARIFDLAYLLTGQLVGKINNPKMVEIWRTLQQKLLSGYNELNPLNTEELEALPILMIAIELLFVAYWNQQGNIDECNKAIELAEWLYNDYGGILNCRRL